MYTTDKLSQQELLIKDVVSSILEESNPNSLSILDSLVRTSIRYGQSRVFPSQTLLGKQVKITRQSVCRIINDHILYKGWFTSRKRYNTTSQYTLNPIIFQEAAILYKVLPSLMILLLKSAPGRYSKRDVTSIYNDIYTTPEGSLWVLGKTIGKRHKAKFWDPLGSSRNETKPLIYVSRDNYLEKKDTKTIKGEISMNKESDNGQYCSCTTHNGCIWSII